MASYLLFCTAMVPAATINELLQTPQSNFLSLVRSPAQTEFDKHSTAPPVAAFETGFATWTSEQIREFIAQRLPGAPHGSNLEPGGYALLDAASERSGTVVLGQAYSPLLMRDPGSMAEDERERWEMEVDDYGEDQTADEEWFEWRVRFKDADRVTTILNFEGDFTPKLYDAEFVAAHTDAEGVFDVEAAWQAFLGSEEAEAEEEQQG